MKISEAAEKIKNADPKKKMRYIAAAIVVLVALALYFSYIFPVGEANGVKAEETDADALSAKLAAILCRIEGAGSVEVLIYYGTTSELVPAYIVEAESVENEGKVSTLRKDELAFSGKDAVIVREDMPQITGVVVAAEGAFDIGVRLNLQSAVTTLLGIPNECVEVLPMQR